MIVIPAYNAEPYLRELLSRIKTEAPKQDILVINDGSTDRTPQILNDLEVEYISYPKNRGKGFALKKGFDYAIGNNYDYVLTLDADLQHLPEEIPRFVDSINGSDIYLGRRSIKDKTMPPHRKLSNYLTSIIISLSSGQRIHDSQCGFRMISTGLLKKLNLRSDKYDLESELLFKAGKLKAKIREVPISTVYHGAPSNINHTLDTFRFIKQTWRRLWL